MEVCAAPVTYLYLDWKMLCLQSTSLPASWLDICLLGRKAGQLRINASPLLEFTQLTPKVMGCLRLVYHGGGGVPLSAPPPNKILCMPVYTVHTVSKILPCIFLEIYTIGWWIQEKVDCNILYSGWNWNALWFEYIAHTGILWSNFVVQRPYRNLPL